MNNTFNVTHKNSAKAVAIFFIIVIAVALIAGCGEDNVVNNNGNPPPVSNERLIFSLDSFNISGTGSVNSDTLFNLSDTTYDSLKCTFTVSSNCDTLDDALLNVTFGDAGLLFFHRDLNNSYTFYAAKNDTFWFALLSRFNTSQQRYIKAVNFKLYLR